MTKATSSTNKLDLYDRLVATIPDVERKGATMPYTSVNGHMFSFLTPARKVALRLPADERETFIKKYKTRLCEQHGTIMKEYVEVPDALLQDIRTLKKFFKQSHAYVSALKPKSAKRVKK